MRNSAMERLLEKQWHHLPAHEVSGILSSHPEIGLTSTEVSERQARFGPNEITARPPRSAWVRFVSKTIEQMADAMAAQGLRVLAFATGTVPAHKRSLHHTDLKTDLTFVGLQGMIDPPRPEAIAAVQQCQSAGIAVKMITGDHVLTATAIAQTIGLGQREQTPGLSGKEWFVHVRNGVSRVASCRVTRDALLKGEVTYAVQQNCRTS